jgi:RNase P/RNase MRP subunit p29
MRTEYIGQPVEIQSSTNKTLEGRKGTILDETKESFVIGNGKEIRVLKRGTTFKIGDKSINGNEITKRPEERMKIKNG